MSARVLRSPKVATFLFTLLAVGLIVGAPGIAQDGEKLFPYPQGLSPEGEATCMNCHNPTTGEPVEPVISVLAPQEVPAGEPFQVKLTVVETWTNTIRPMELQKLYAGLDITGAENLAFPGENEPETFTLTGSVQAGIPNIPDQPAPVSEQPFTVKPGPTDITATVVAAGGPTTVVNMDLRLVSPSGQVFPEPYVEGGATNTDPADPKKASVAIDREALATAGSGEWKAQVRSPCCAPSTADYTVTITVNYGGSDLKQVIVQGPDKLLPGEPHTFTFDLIALDTKGEAEIVVGSMLDMYYKHDSGGNQNLGSWQGTARATILVGDKLVGGVEAPIAIGGGDSTAAEMKAWSEVIGFASSFILIPSLVMGGTFGKSTVTFFNKILGAARRRVLWHNSMSFMLLGLSVLHMVLFLIEPRYEWDVGVIWGGLALACMIGLGVTGAMQKLLVKRWGFGTWRFVHFGMGILIVGFVLLHMGLDGAHFSDVRDFAAGTSSTP